MKNINLKKLWSNILKYKIPVVIISLGIVLVLSSAGLFLMSPGNGNTDNEETSSENESSSTGSSESSEETNPDSKIASESENSDDSSMDSSDEVSSEISSQEESSNPGVTPTKPPVASATPVPTQSVTGKNLMTWTPASGTKSNNTYEVSVRETGKTQWTKLFV